MASSGSRNLHGGLVVHWIEGDGGGAIHGDRKDKKGQIGGRMGEGYAFLDLSLRYLSAGLVLWTHNLRSYIEPF